VQLAHRPPESTGEIDDLIMRAHTAVSLAGRSFSPECIATTFTMVRFVHGRMMIGHVGDSFVLRVRDEECSALTTEHNVGNEHRDLLASAPFPPIHPNALTRVLGQVEPLVVDVSESEVETGDIVVLATDGLTNMLGTESIAQICTMDSDPASLADKLITAALRNGGRDNITVIVVSVRED
jgi:protein phosphatase